MRSTASRCTPLSIIIVLKTIDSVKVARYRCDTLNVNTGIYI